MSIGKQSLTEHYLQDQSQADDRVLLRMTPSCLEFLLTSKSNIESFLSTMHAFGLNKDKMFQANDVVEMKNAEKVCENERFIADVVGVQ